VTLLLYAAIIVVCAAVAYPFGMVLGNDFACSSSSGNLCPLAGVFIIGPLVSACAIAILRL
jgi:hypothetical protein